MGKLLEWGGQRKKANELEGRSMEIIKSEQQRKKKDWKDINGTWGTCVMCNLDAREDKKDWGKKKKCHQIAKIWWKTYISEISEAQQISNR